MKRKVKIFLFSFIFFFPLFFVQSTPDLTIIGYIIPEDGLGKIPINILETLGDQFSANIRVTRNLPNLNLLPKSVIAALNNPDQATGKVAISTVGLWHREGINTIQMPEDSLIKIAYSMFETTKIPSMWVKKLNEEFDAVVVPDKYLINVYEECGVAIPIFILPIPMQLEPYFSHVNQSKIPSSPFIFADASANKNPSALIKGFAKAFGNNPAVKLVLRACAILPETREIFEQLKKHYHLSNITLEEGSLSSEEYNKFLSSIDCYVNLSKGEGFSLIPRESLALGIPVIITHNTASITICESGLVRVVPSRKKVPPLQHYQWLFDEVCGYQFDCKSDDVAMAFLDVYKNYKKYKAKAERGRVWVEQYSCKNEKLRKLYATLIKPEKIIAGNKNEIKEGVMMTNSSSLRDKYLQIIQTVMQLENSN